MAKKPQKDWVTILQKALKLAALDYFRGCKLAEDQEEELLHGKVDEWLERAGYFD